MHLPKGMTLAQRSHTVAWLTAVHIDKAQNETVNAILVYKSKADNAEQVKRKNNNQPEDDWKDDIQFNV